MRRGATRIYSQRGPKFFFAFIVSVIGTAAGISAAASIANEAKPGITLSGIVTDSACGFTHGTTTQGDAECTRMCVGLGAGYALADRKKTYLLKGHEPELNRFAGERVLVRGEMVGPDTVAVESVEPSLIAQHRHASHLMVDSR